MVKMCGHLWHAKQQKQQQQQQRQGKEKVSGISQPYSFSLSQGGLTVRL